MPFVCLSVLPFGPGPEREGRLGGVECVYVWGCYGDGRWRRLRGSKPTLFCAIVVWVILVQQTFWLVTVSVLDRSCSQFWCICSEFDVWRIGSIEFVQGFQVMNRSYHNCGCQKMHVSVVSRKRDCRVILSCSFTLISYTSKICISLLAVTALQVWTFLTIIYVCNV